MRVEAEEARIGLLLEVSTSGVLRFLGEDSWVGGFFLELAIRIENAERGGVDMVLELGLAEKKRGLSGDGFWEKRRKIEEGLMEKLR